MCFSRIKTGLNSHFECGSTFLLKKKYDSTRVCRGTGGEEQGRNRTSWRGTEKIRAACFPPGFSPGFFQDFHVFECLFSVYFRCSAVPLFPTTLFLPQLFAVVFLLWPVLPLISFSSHPSDGRFPRHSFFLFMVWLPTLFLFPSLTAFCCAHFSFSGFEKVGVVSRRPDEDEQGVDEDEQGVVEKVVGVVEQGEEGLEQANHKNTHKHLFPINSILPYFLLFPSIFPVLFFIPSN